MALVLGSANTASASGPQRVMSLSLCTDELLISLLAPARIASVTYLAQSADNAQRWREAATLRTNHGTAEEILAHQPDLVLTSTYTGTTVRALLQRAGTPLVEIPSAHNFDEIRTITRTVARAVGEEAKGERLLADMNQILENPAAARPTPPIRVAAWDGSGTVPARDTLFDAILTAAGGANVAAAQHGTGQSAFSLEALLLARPTVLVYGTADTTARNLHTDFNQHPLLLARYAQRRISLPEVHYACGTPDTAKAVAGLRAKLIAATATVPP